MEHCDGEIPTKRPKLFDGGNGSEDRLSALPDDILIQILLKLLDVPVAARTSVLSSRWRRLWTMLPELDFPDHSDPQHISLVLTAHEAPALHRLSVEVLNATAKSVAAWLPMAAGRLSGCLLLHIERRRNETEEGAAEGGTIELPCLETATSIDLALEYLGLAMPLSGVFAKLTHLFLNCVKLHGPIMLGDVVSSGRCPALQTLTVQYSSGVRDIAIHSDSLLQLDLCHLRGGVRQLTIKAPALELLVVDSCFAKLSSKIEPVANIFAPQLVFLLWWDVYDPRFMQLGEMKNLQSLSTNHFDVYSQENRAQNNYCLRLLWRFELIQSLTWGLFYPSDITNQQYLMEDITRLPDITKMVLRVMPKGHSFGASVFHVLRMCTGVRKLKLVLPLFQAQTACPSGCVCDQPPNWKTEELTLNRLRQVAIRNLRGTEHEAALIKRLFDWATVLEKMTVTFHCSVAESQAKEFFQMLQSFSRTEGPEICMKKGPRFA